MHLRVALGAAGLRQRAPVAGLLAVGQGSGIPRPVVCCSEDCCISAFGNNFPSAGRLLEPRAPGTLRNR